MSFGREVKLLIKNKNMDTLKDLLNQQDAYTIIELFQNMEIEEKDEMAIVFRLLSKDLALAVFEQLDTSLQERLLNSFTDETANELFAGLAPDDRAKLLDELPAKVAKRLLNSLSKEEMEKTADLLGYAPETAGRIMTPEYVSLKENMTAAEALDKIRNYDKDFETIYILYVTDDNRKLIGVLSLRDLVKAQPQKAIKEIMSKSVVSVTTGTDQEEVAKLLQKRDLLAVPVVDRENRLVGIVTSDDVLDVVGQETTEDFHKMAPMGKIKVNLLDANIFMLVQKRVPWLLVLVFMNIFSGAGIAHFEETIEAVIALVFFLPLLIDSGGNSGSQSATLMVRALAVGDVKISDWFKLIRKEISVALIMGGLMGLAVSVIGYFRAGPEVALVVAMSMIVIVLVGCTIGMSLPFILSKLKMDPATASAPLITSIADICGVLIYFSIATWYLKI